MLYRISLFGNTKNLIKIKFLKSMVDSLLQYLETGKELGAEIQSHGLV